MTINKLKKQAAVTIPTPQKAGKAFLHCAVSTLWSRAFFSLVTDVPGKEYSGNIGNGDSARVTDFTLAMDTRDDRGTALDGESGFVSVSPTSSTICSPNSAPLSNPAEDGNDGVASTGCGPFGSGGIRHHDSI